MIVGSILGYIALFFILNPDYMGAEQYGIIGFGLAYVGLFAFITDLGFNWTHIKRVSEGQDLGKSIGTFLTIKIVLNIIMVIIVISSILFWKFVLGRGFETQEHEHVIYLFIIYHVLLSISTVPLQTFSARRETAKQQLSAIIETLIRVPLAIFIAVNSLGVFALAGSYVIGVFFMFIVSFYMFKKYPIKKFDMKTFKSYYLFAIPISVSSGIAMISTNIDKVMLQLFWDSTLVGYYFGVQRLTAVIIFMSIAVSTLLFPTLSRYHGKNDYREIRRLTISAERYVSIVIVPSVVFFIVFSKPLLNLIHGDMAQNASTIFQLMAVYSLFVCFYKIFANQIIAINKPSLGAKIGISMAVLNIILNLILIPKDIKSLGVNLMGMGAEGAALATTISMAYGLLISKHFARKLTGTPWNPKIFLHLFAAIIMGLVLYFIAFTVPFFGC
jgi:O-antigen/teichoic acid export membrane protein